MNRLSTFIQRPLSMWNRDKSQVHSHHLDLSADNGRAHLSRNKTERVRLQGLQRGLTVKARPSTPVEDMSVRQRWKLWMINEGSQRVFLIIWTFLHLLVLTLGFLNYQLNDSYTNARKTFGVGFGETIAVYRDHC
jgi:ribosome modulation factor